MLAFAASAQEGKHTDFDGTEPLLRRSAFAHGFAHGYDEGFHVANLALHMSHGRKNAQDVIEKAKLRTTYTKQFGDRRNFVRGFRQGFEAGYNDVYDSRPYRMVTAMRDAATGLTQGARTKTFDEGFIAGMKAGGEEVTDRPWGSERLPMLVEHCRGNGMSAEYCEGYARGFRFGNQQMPPRERTQTASK